MILLPNEFKNRMKELLGPDFESFIKSYDSPCFRGLRVNTLKVSTEKFKKLINFNIRPCAFASDSFYINDIDEKIGNSPLHHAGAFYVQEPSASSAVTALDPQPNEKILDLCAAPGGKSTQIAAKLQQTGLLWSNEIVKSRANILLSNIERMGIKNAVVSSCHPEILCGKLAGFFDKILVDAPCSGEGMFRKNSNAADEWSPEHVAMCAARQSAILESAKSALKSGGVLVYSTCTFSAEENEKVVENFLLNNKDFELVEINQSFGRNAFKKFAPYTDNIELARRIFPEDGGEGHFVAKMKKRGNGNEFANIKKYEYKKSEKRVERFYYDLFFENLYGHIEAFNNNFLILPHGLPNLKGLGVIRAGVQLCEASSNNFIPSHAAFMAAPFDAVKNKISFSADSKEINDFLKGFETDVQNHDLKNGFCAVAVDEIITGFGKYSCGKIKNKYPKGLRLK